MEFSSFIVLLAFCVSVTQTTSVTEAFEDSGIVPEIIPKAPSTELGLTYEKESANLGNTLMCPFATAMPPTLSFDAKPGSYYIFIYFNPDTPSRALPLLRSVLIAVYINLANTSLSSGFPIVSYISPAPNPGTGAHRIVALVYEQEGVLNITNRRWRSKLAYRVRFPVNDFVTNNTLGNPIAGNFFYAEVPSRYQNLC